MIVLDTHIFIWFMKDDPRLSSKLKQFLEQSPTEVIVPSICIWEALMLIERGRLAVVDENPAAKLRRSIGDAGFVEAALTSEIAALSRTLSFNHNDPADRFIAATAYALGASLATSDRNLRELPWVSLAD